MALETNHQIEEFIKKSKNILLLLPFSPSGDALGAAWALHFSLKEKGIETEIFFDDPYNHVSLFNFLPHPSLTTNISEKREFVLIFDTSRNKISDTHIEKEEDKLKIFITPEKGFIEPRDFSFIPARFKYDLLIILGSPDKESLGTIYEKHSDIFFEIPIINIDNHNENENFGQINLVDVTASSVSEIVFKFLEKSEFSLSEKTANCLLFGIINATNSFKEKNTTPQSLEISARLIGLGADQQNIIRHLYKTQPLNILKLWGRVMSQLKWNEELKIIWVTVSLDDFIQSRSQPKDLPLILEKIKENYSAGKIFLALYSENQNFTRGIVQFSREEDLLKFTRLFNGKRRNSQCEFVLENKSLLEAEKETLEKIKSLFV